MTTETIDRFVELADKTISVEETEKISRYFDIFSQLMPIASAYKPPEIILNPVYSDTVLPPGHVLVQFKNREPGIISYDLLYRNFSKIISQQYLTKRICQYRSIIYDVLNNFEVYLKNCGYDVISILCYIPKYKDGEIHRVAIGYDNMYVTDYDADMKPDKFTYVYKNNIAYLTLAD